VSQATESFIQDLLRSVPELERLFKEHLDDNEGTVLPHVFMGDVTRFAIAATKDVHMESVLQRILAQMNTGVAEGNEDVRELVTVSFLENLLGEDAAVAVMKPLMDPVLASTAANLLG
jgi:hypothetical protein